MAGVSRCQGACPLRGAFGGLDRGFPGVFSSYTRIRTRLAVLDAGSTPSFYHQTTKEGPMDPLCCLVEMAGVEPASKSISERLSPSAAACCCFAHPSPYGKLGARYPVDTLTLPGAYARGPCMVDARFSDCR